MPKSVPKASSEVSQQVNASGTPAGVWVIIGLAVFLVVSGLGVSAFVVWKAVGSKVPVSATNDSVDEEAIQIRNAKVSSDGEVGVEHPKPNPAIKESGELPPVVSDRTEEDRTRQEVLKRIDLMRALTDGEKDKLYAQVERARGFKKIAVIPFTQNRMVPGAAQMDGLIKSLNGPDLRNLLADPTVGLIMVGYVDKGGDESKNLEISRTRAENVLKVLKEKVDLVNLMHAVGMGGQELVDQTDHEKNRVVEVWAVQP